MRQAERLITEGDAAPTAAAAAHQGGSQTRPCLYSGNFILASADVCRRVCCLRGDKQEKEWRHWVLVGGFVYVDTALTFTLHACRLHSEVTQDIADRIEKCFHAVLSKKLNITILFLDAA
jgi:hypothetical protein